MEPSAVKGSGISQAEIDRSYEIQAELARIEQDREAFIEELFDSWRPVLNPAVYDLENFRPIARAATAWSLYGASLVGDYQLMLRILMGKERPGAYVNRLPQPEPRRPPIAPDALGATTNSLVFTPIAPCRLVDTRGTGARTGIMNPGVPRVFDLTTAGLTEGQGGDTTCPGLPSTHHGGWSFNVTATGHTDIGGLKVYPFNGTEPSTSNINYFPAAFAIANHGAFRGCFGCVDDITIVTFGNPTHVIVDVLGYYEQATGFFAGTAAITTVMGTATSVAANTNTFVNGGSCPAGTSPISGGHSNTASGANAIITSDHYISGQLWTEYVRNPGPNAATVTMRTNCIDN